ncbi:MAG: hypothetical protein K9L30_13175 [Desulfobacterales bacterium]|nr:hypothetical protein [Desulfobacterales bacterium]
MKETSKFLIIGSLILIAAVSYVSNKNKDRYYLIAKHGSVEIWQGAFAPIGKNRLTILPGLQLKDPIKNAYTKDQVFPLASSYYINRADALLGAPGMPDFEGIISDLNKALHYATDETHLKIANERLNSINLMFIMYKADVALIKGRLPDLETALSALSAVNPETLSQEQFTLVSHKISSIRKLIASINKM